MGTVFKTEAQGNAGGSYATAHTPNIHYTKYNMEYCFLAFFLKIPLSSKARQNLPDAKNKEGKQSCNSERGASQATHREAGIPRTGALTPNGDRDQGGG